MLIKTVFFLLITVFYIFIYWKELKEDYFETVIFNSVFIILAFVSLGIAISIRFFPASWFWAAFISSIFGLLTSCIRYKMRPFEVLDALAPSSFMALALYFFYEFIIRRDTYSLISSTASISIFILFYFLQGRYKKILWYKSGKAGFSSLFVMCLFLFFRSLSSLKLFGMISLDSKLDAIISLFLSIVMILAIFILGRAKT